MLQSLTGGHLTDSVGGTDPEPWRNVIEQRETVADAFRKRGYETAAFNPNAYVSSYFGFDKGFDHYQDFLTESRRGSSLYRSILDRLNQSGKSGPLASIRNVLNLVQREEVFKPWEHFLEDIVEWVESATEPYFLWILLLDPHHPYLAPKEYRTWSSLLGMWRSNFRVTQVMNDETADLSSELSDRDKQDLLDAYDDSIRYADQFIDRLTTGLADTNPAYVIHADHGEAFGEHGPHGHHTSLLYDTLLHVPLVVHNGGITGRVEEQFSLRNLKRLLLDLGAGELKDLRNLGRSRFAVSEVSSDAEKVNTAVRGDHWKYIDTDADGTMLFNLQNDPDEHTDCAEDNQEVVNQLSALAESHRNMKTERQLISESIPSDQM